jgi:Methyltransferase domain
MPATRSSRVRAARTLRAYYTGLIDIRIGFVLLVGGLLFVSLRDEPSDGSRMLRTSTDLMMADFDAGYPNNLEDGMEQLNKGTNQQQPMVDRGELKTSSAQKGEDKVEPKRNPASPLDIPQGNIVALPSIPTDQSIPRGQYGGKGDPNHLGWFTAYDMDGVSPRVWKEMISNLGIKSILDVGCGKGVSSLWFLEHGVNTLCLEGSHDAVKNTLLPDPQSHIVEHDFSRGPYWTSDTFDAVWSVEFIQHVGRNYQYNYMQSFRKAALIFVSHSQWGGWYVICIPETCS